MAEILMTVTVLTILSSFFMYAFSEGRELARDAERQSDLQRLEMAIEAYRQDNGRYPEGCNGPLNWSGQVGSTHACAGTTAYIEGLAPKYISALPVDPQPVSGGVDKGFAYTVNSDRTVYKIMVRGTVESETVDYNHALKSCDISESGGVETGICIPTTTYTNCNNANALFKTSYGIWGGYAEPNVAPNHIDYDDEVKSLTRAVICK